MASLSKKNKWILALVLVLVLGTLISMALSTWGLTVSRFQVVTDEISHDFRVVHLTDLHGSEFGAGNKRLLEKVAAEAPDLILVTGDLVTQTKQGTGVATALLEELVKLAPTYVSLGNHEFGYDERFGADCAALFAATGARVLDFAWEDITVNGEKIRLGGIYGYCLAEKFLATNEAQIPEIEFLKKFQSTDRFTLLMAHIPVSWLINGSLTEWDADCVFSGHLHGGQFRLPLIGGVYGPDMGFFPGQVAGQYSGGGNTLILSRGLGTSIPIPRLNNIPEIVVTDFVAG